MEADIGSESRLLPNPPVFNAPLGGSHQNIAMAFGTEKLEWCGYLMVKNLMARCLNHRAPILKDSQDDICSHSATILLTDR